MEDLQTDIRQFCVKHRLKLNTELGQHFLIDQNVLNAIVEAADINASDHVVEIGPGIGVLTKELLRKARKVTAIELDDRMIPLLKRYTKDSPKLTVIRENALHVGMPPTPYKIVANIPYHITSPLLRHVFLESNVPPTSMTLLIQREVADRICPPVRPNGRAGDTENAGMLTIIVGLFGKPEKVINVPPKAFLPPPEVDSAVIHIACYGKPLVDAATLERVMKFTKIAFGMKRKMLRNSFGTFPGGLELLSVAGIAETRRPQTLTVEEWIAVARASVQA